MLKPGGKLVLFEGHQLAYMEWDDKATTLLDYAWALPKEDGTKWGYFEDEGKPREVICNHLSNGDSCYLVEFWTLAQNLSQSLRVLAPKYHYFDNTFENKCSISFPLENSNSLLFEVKLVIQVALDTFFYQCNMKSTIIMNEVKL